ncbi:MAG: SDR family oxidoreductase, partial [Ginsengibacter sp.]
MKVNNQQKVAVVTGGASGIGLAIAEKFIKNNIVTIIIGRNKNKLNSAKNKLGELCIPISFDLDKLSSIPQLINNIIAEHGKIDILVNNAGINLKKEFKEVTDEEF